MKAILKCMTVEDFKGIEHLAIEFNEGKTVVRGDNATGKTSLMDAFIWLLTDKDSQGKTDFKIKPIGKEGAAPRVSALFDVDGDEVTLEKQLHEQWVKRRGSTQAVMTGHKNVYKVDGVEERKKDFDAAVGRLGAEWLIRTLTNPFYFTSLSWQDRRKIIMDVAPSVNDDELITDEVRELVGKQPIDRAQKRITDELKQVKKQMDSMPAVITELKKQTEGAEDPEEIKELIDKAKGDDAQADLKRRLKVAKESAQDYRRQAERERKSAIEEAERDLQTKNLKLDAQVENVGRMMGEAERIEKQIKNHEAEIEKVRAHYSKVRAQMQEYDTTRCPLCEQEAPNAKELVKQYTSHLTEKLREINDHGKGLRDTIEQKRIEVARYHEAIEKENAKIDAMEKEVLRARDAVKKAQEVEYEADKKAAEQEQVVEELNTQVGESGGEVDTSELEARLAKAYAAKEAAERLKAVDAEEKELVTKHEKLKNDFTKINDFVIKKIKAVESRVNEMFELARFQMFDEQLNGEIKETCEITDKEGVPYYRGLNRGAQTNIGLDIVKTLSELYGVYMPVWVDNTESVTRLNDGGLQVVALKVDGGAAALIIEN